ncbi:MAG: hypothetical protein F4X80_11400 [Chloroflexi bacterium]|nr:hypothetical protein [Chloroflexota bacterium]
MAEAEQLVAAREEPEAATRRHEERRRACTREAGTSAAARAHCIGATPGNEGRRDEREHEREGRARRAVQRHLGRQLEAKPIATGGCADGIESTEPGDRCRRERRPGHQRCEAGREDRVRLESRALRGARATHRERPVPVAARTREVRREPYDEDAAGGGHLREEERQGGAVEAGHAACA